MPSITPESTPAPQDSRSLYLDLLKRALINWIYGREEARYGRYSYLEIAMSVLRRKGGWSMRPRTFNPETRNSGRDWPAFAHSMIGWRRMDHLQGCVETVLDENVPGDFFEAGVWRGGASIFMRGALQAYGVKDRTVWLADSFQGLPASKARQDRKIVLHRCDDLSVSRAEVEENFRRYGLLDAQVSFLEGWFADSLKTFAPRPLAILRVDGDLYSSTMDVLTHLYPMVSAGGYVIVDDYLSMQCCKEATDEYRTAHGITDEIHAIDGDAVFWRKSSKP